MSARVVRTRRIGAAVYGAAACLLLPAAASAVPQIHAHRGGPTLDGRHVFGEETMSAIRNAWLVEGAVLELDAKLTADRVPVTFHDATLDRTTPCEGRVDAKSRAELEACPVDVVGSPGAELGGAPASVPDRIPDLVEALTFARDSGATVNLEIKNVPTEVDFDASSGFAETVMDAVVASGISAQRLIVQSFWPPNLDVAEQRLPGVETALLTLGATNDGGPAFAAAHGYEWVSPQWPVSAGYVEQAHALGRRVVPYTINTADGVRGAAAVGVDAVITDDPRMARRALGLPVAAEAPGAVGPPSIRLRLPPLASDLGTGPAVTIGWSSSGAASHALEVRRGSGSWRPLASGPAKRHAFEGRPGVTYGFRVRARDAAGNVSAWATDELVFPVDARRLGRGWRVRRERRAWGGSVAVARRGARAMLRLRGRRLWLVAPVGPRGGRLEVRVDGRRRVVSLRARRAVARRRVLSLRRLRAGRQVVRLRALGGAVALDAVAFAP